MKCIQVLKKQFCMFSNHATSVVTWCFTSIVQGCQWVYVKTRRRQKLRKMSIKYLDCTYATIYFAKKSQNLHMPSF